MATTVPSAPKTQRVPDKEIPEEDLLKAAIPRTFPGASGQMCIHQIGDHTYRVNWHDASGGNDITASKFVQVNTTPDGIQIEDLSIRHKTRSET